MPEQATRSCDDRSRIPTPVEHRRQIDAIVRRAAENAARMGGPVMTEGTDV